MRFVWSVCGSLSTMAVLVAVATFSACDSSSERDSALPDTIDEPPTQVALTLLHTSDLHHRGTGYGARRAYTPLDTLDQDPTLGGYARLAALIRDIRSAQANAGVPVVVVDSGDFLMGTLFDLSFEAPLAFRFFETVGYDAVTLGNHEFDAGLEALAGWISQAQQADPPFSVPLVATNLVFSDTEGGDDMLAVHVKSKALRKQLLLELPNGMRLGLIGLLGEDAEDAAVPMAPLEVDHSTSLLSTRIVALREKEKVDLVVALAHSGFDAGLEDGAVVELAEKVKGIDVIASGHSHLVTTEPYRVGETLIVQAGFYGQWLGRLDLVLDAQTRQLVEVDYELLPVDDSVEGDEEVHRMVEESESAVDEVLAQATGVSATAAVAELSFDMGRVVGEEGALGNFVADAQRYGASLALLASDDPHPIDVALQPAGMVRDDLHADGQGVVAFSDLFNVLPLGVSPPLGQELPGLGWPMISFYVTARELAQACQISTLHTRLLGPGVFIHVSGMRCDYDGTTGAVSHVRLCRTAVTADGPGDLFSEDCSAELDQNDRETLYRVATDLFSFEKLQRNAALVGLYPKWADGSSLVVDGVDRSHPALIMQPDEQRSHPLVVWEAVLAFLSSFSREAGNPDVPDIPVEAYGPEGGALGRFLAH
jgi:2',3'-cyclic-nucleotide 2'-phosphodiesterase (5'-nucleotidase family)